VGHYLYITEYKFGNTNARSSGATISISSGAYIILETHPTERCTGQVDCDIYRNFALLKIQKKRAIKF